MSLSSKIVSSQVGVVLVAVAVTAGVCVWRSANAFRSIQSETERGLAQNEAAVHEVETAMLDASVASMTQQARQVVAMCGAQEEVVESALAAYLAVARELVARAGGVSCAADTVAWQAVDQFSGAAREVELPRLMLGDEWLGQNAAGDVATPIVDDVTRVLGCTCTIFQRMNDAGDMLRAATTVKKKDGARAIGTYIPATNPDGAPNPVVAAILRGERYVGRARVVDSWNFTAYEPLEDNAGKIVGMLYTGIPESFAAALRSQIIDQKVGKTGYIFVIKGTGDLRGQYVISKDGKRDGENIWESKDADGRLIIQEMCRIATALGPGEIGEIRYQWKNADDPAPREKLTKLAYYAPWDWVIGVGTYMEEISAVADGLRETTSATLAATQQIGQQAQRGATIAGGIVGGGAILFAAVFALLIGRSIARPIQRVIKELAEGAAQVDSASAQIATASQALAAGASQQAGSLEETSSALEQTAARTRKNADGAAQANAIARQARDSADQGGQVVQELDGAMQGINQASQQISKILKVIEEIAFQTNLLALNAAVEAARAGEHGRGFAVVADEVRKLAQRAAGAAGEISELVDNALERSRAGVQIAESVGNVLGGILVQTRRVSELIEGISTAAREQSEGIEQINAAVSEMDRVTQQNAASAEECASAAEQLSAQSRTVAGMVTALTSIVAGGRAGSSGVQEAAH
jgi:hypothetical protein